ncbi:MFS transporter [Bordetella pseudohinzii]|uniref:Inner membrane transport protein ydhP n=1 Tax=Bordetella pseudohinzii TaxID=1331258 RepID=A0A0J6C9C3_9BORD|nr:MFS transporter [Bordetella pseudohinzii]ANY16480.1 MFS transporter [Bordetella pseudohinzii]KMM27623.1 MFS transporter [Bordetella pseudohinzii]KXA81554.1 MFS transporter [Bordetella pseudohinzii]KXA82086.1 MFS transporter [Bordetella pseudohinzii]CUI35658.1 Inner membrane transport protein ydhP [Bordetella pseudohinzii]
MSTSAGIADELAPPSSELSPAQTRRALFALGVGGFGIGTGEFVIMGLLPDAARDLGISIPQAGHLISIYALGVVIGAPLLAVLGARLPRRSFLIGLMLVFALGNMVSAMAPGFASMALARFLTGFPHGTYFGVAALVAAGLVPLHRRTQAVAMVLLGLTIATLVGVPIAAAIGQWLGWRSAFAIVGAIGLLTALLVWRWVPYSPGNKAASPLRELDALRRKQVILTLGIGAIGSGGIFSVFSYIKPTMIEVAHLPEAWVPLVLALFGAGMVGGNLLGSRLADRNMERTIRYVLIWAAIVMSAFFLTSHSAVLGSLNVLLIGTVVALGATLQTRLMDVAGDAQTLAAALNHSAFNIANALGAWLGGVAIDAGLGWSSTGWVGGLLALAGLAIHYWALADMRRRA